MKRYLAIMMAATMALAINAQNADKLTGFQNKFDNYKARIDRKYDNYLRGIWAKCDAYAPLKVPEEKVEPVVRHDKDTIEHRDITIKDKNLIDFKEDKTKPIPAPQPVVDTTPSQKTAKVVAFNTPADIHYPADLPSIATLSVNTMADTWDQMHDGRFDQCLTDCHSAYVEHNFCDWAYVCFLKEVARSVYSRDANMASLLYAFLLDSNGYDIRIGKTTDAIVTLIASNHEIYNKPYFKLDNKTYYPINNDQPISQMEICGMTGHDKRPMSLYINNEQNLALAGVTNRTITSTFGTKVQVTIPVNQSILDFYTTYPTSRVNGDHMTRWAMYAQTPIDPLTRKPLYEQLRKYIDGKTPLQAANILLNFVQTGLIYKYDEEIWGEDRAFFAEESLHYPYCDCEDRSILFSHLIIDLLGLDCALVYTPGHLFTAVKFPTAVPGSTLTINNTPYTICEPTCTNGAPVGWSALPDSATTPTAIPLLH